MNKRYRCNTASFFFVLNWKSSPHNFDHFSPKLFLLFGCGCFVELFKLQQCTNSSVTLFICPLYIFFFFLVPPCHYLILEVRTRQGFAMKCSFYIFLKKMRVCQSCKSMFEVQQTRQTTTLFTLLSSTLQMPLMLANQMNVNAPFLWLCFINKKFYL